MANQRDQTITNKPNVEKDFVPMTAGSETVTAGNKARGSELMQQAKSAAGTAYDSVAGRAASTLDEKKAGLSAGLGNVAESIRKAGDSLTQTQNKDYVTEHSARYANNAAQKLEQAARYFETSDLQTMRRDAESFARRNPAVFLGGAFVLGMLAARFLKSSPNTGRISDRSEF